MNPEMKSPSRIATGYGLDGSLGTTQNQHSTRPTRLAPFGRQVIAHQRAGIEPNVFIYAGSNCWNLGKQRCRSHGEGTALVLPPDDDPETYRWPALDALCAIPGDCDGDRFRRLVLVLLATGCRCVVEVRPFRAPACHYASSGARVA